MWALIFGWIISAAVSFLLTPKPQTPNRRQIEAATEAEVPVAKEGGAIAVVFGTVWIKNPTVVWYGDLRAEPIRG